MKTVLFSDLDDTFVFSQRGLYSHGQKTTGHVVVEERNNSPVGYMAWETYQILHDHAAKVFDFIPTTTRTMRQFQRIQFPKIQYNCAVILNGAKILIDGQEDMNWTRMMQELVLQEEYSPSQVLQQVVNTFSTLEGVKAIHDADGFFTYLVTKSGYHQKLETMIAAIAEDYNQMYSRQGRKHYLIPRPISKGRAVAEIIARCGYGYSFAAGDSILDLSMADEVTEFIVPFHGVNQGTHGLNIKRTCEKGSAASVEIVRTVRDYAVCSDSNMTE